MTKNDLVTAMSHGAKITKAEAEAALNALVDAVEGALARHEKVTLVGFGTFSVSRRAARSGRDPRTGAAISIPASSSARFKAGKKLQDAVNKDGSAQA